MYQIKIFEGNGNNESDVNTWLKDNPGIEVVSVSIQPLYDFYGAGNYLDAQPQICNQWLATVVIYKEGVTT
ncbi:MAG: hypothetical protein WHF31_16215 [Candidatus Dehalobacter alkaniphilus]